MAGDFPYRIIWSRKALAALKKMRVAFHSAGSLGEFKDSLLRLDLRLRTSPTDLGEMCWARGSVQQHVAALRPVAINFAVDKSRKIVFVTSAHALAGPGAKDRVMPSALRGQ